MIQLYHLKRTPDVQKAERFFKERRVAIQYVDLNKHKLGMRELMSVAKAVGLRNLVDDKSVLWKESTVQFLHGEEAILEALCLNPKLLRFPILRNGARAAVGIAPEIWASWIE